MTSDDICKSKKVDKKIKIYSFSIRDLLLGKNYSFSQRRAVKAALEDISSTRKTGHIAKSRKVKILEELAQHPPDLVEYACDWYVEKNCASEGKNERYLLAIVRNQAKQREINKQKQHEAQQKEAALNKDKLWQDGNAVYAREDMERWQSEIATEQDPERLDPTKCSRVNRCIKERPEWDWK